MTLLPTSLVGQGANAEVCLLQAPKPPPHHSPHHTLDLRTLANLGLFKANAEMHRRCGEVWQGGGGGVKRCILASCMNEDKRVFKMSRCLLASQPVSTLNSSSEGRESKLQWRCTVCVQFYGAAEGTKHIFLPPSCMSALDCCLLGNSSFSTYFA